MFFIIALIVSTFIFGIVFLLFIANIFDIEDAFAASIILAFLLLTGLWVFYNAWKIAGMIA